MPEDYKDKKMVMLCNDCLEKSTVPFHIAGGKCSKCRSYNTTRIDDHENDDLKEPEVEEELSSLIAPVQRPIYSSQSRITSYG